MYRQCPMFPIGRYRYRDAGAMLRLARKRLKKLRHVLPAYRRREVVALKAVDSQRLQFVEFLQAIYAFGNTAAAGQLAVEDKASDQR